MTQTTHDLVTEQYREEYSKPNSDAPGSSGYVEDDNYQHLNKPVVSFDEVARLLIEKSESITPRQLLEIKRLLAG